MTGEKIALDAQEKYQDQDVFRACETVRACVLMYGDDFKVCGLNGFLNDKFEEWSKVLPSVHKICFEEWRFSRNKQRDNNNSLGDLIGLENNFEEQMFQ